MEGINVYVPVNVIDRHANYFTLERATGIDRVT